MLVRKSSSNTNILLHLSTNANVIHCIWFDMSSPHCESHPNPCLVIPYPAAVYPSRGSGQRRYAWHRHHAVAERIWRRAAAEDTLQQRIPEAVRNLLTHVRTEILFSKARRRGNNLPGKSHVPEGCVYTLSELTRLVKQIAHLIVTCYMVIPIKSNPTQCPNHSQLSRITSRVAVILSQ